MNKIIIIPLIGLILSLVLHVLVSLRIYLPGNAIVFPLTVGMLLSWLHSTRILKEMNEDVKDINPWRFAFSFCPPWLKYLSYFLLVYAFLNFLMVAGTEPGNDWINLNPDFEKIRGISGFWIAFYSLSVSFISAQKKYLLQQKSS